MIDITTLHLDFSREPGAVAAKPVLQVTAPTVQRQNLIGRTDCRNSSVESDQADRGVVSHWRLDGLARSAFSSRESVCVVIGAA